MLQVRNVTGLYSVEVARIDVPVSTQEVSASIKAWPGKVAIGGGRYSMGGQVAIRGGLHLDMRAMNRLLWLRLKERVVRVQAGMRWRDLQEQLDPLGLAVKTMQSYSNFTVGGSVSVNVHGRYIGHGPIGHTVRALQLVLADGTVIEATPRENTILFRAAIGGYGAIGVVTEVELELAENVRLERVIEEVPLERYVQHFKDRVMADKDAVLHNADLMPPLFDLPLCTTWRRAPDDKPLTETEKLVPRGKSYSKEQNLIWALSELPAGASLRRNVIEPMLRRGPIVKWLNHEASMDVAQLEPRTRAMSTYALQEYFVPERNLVTFLREMVRVLQAHGVVVLNISLRHSPSDRVSMLPWAREDVFSLVLYYKQRTWKSAQIAVERWTRELISVALRHAARYYLPYQLHATRPQFDAAYPEAEELRNTKRAIDPLGKMSNEMWEKYL